MGIMKIRFRRCWRHYKAGAETEAVPDGIATTLIRIGAAALVEDVSQEQVKHDNTPQPVHDSDKQPDSDNGPDSGTDNAGGSKTPTVSGGVGHKPGRRANQPNSGRP
jgi:hypothetical protein